MFIQAQDFSQVNWHHHVLSTRNIRNLLFFSVVKPNGSGKFFFFFFTFVVFRMKSCIGKLRGLELLVQIACIVIYLYPKHCPNTLFYKKFQAIKNLEFFLSGLLGYLLLFLHCNQHPQKLDFWTAVIFQLEVKTTVYEKQKHESAILIALIFKGFAIMGVFIKISCQ